MSSDTTTQQLSFDQLAHQASNEALCISIGVHVLQTIPAEHLDEAQLRALRHLEQTSARLADLIEGMRSHSTDWPEN